MRNLIIIVALLLSQAGCSTAPVSENAAETTGAATEAPDTEAVAAISEVRVIPQRPFPDDSIYPLLVAEFALRRRDYALALEQYMDQAHRLRDAGVSAHTVRLAQFLRRDEDAIEAAQLWVELEPDNLEARLSLANLLAQKGDGLAAVPHMAAIVRGGGSANFSALANGFEKLPADKKTAMMTAIAELRQEFPQNTQLMICNALMLEATGKPEAALAELQLVFVEDEAQLQAIVMDAKLRQDLQQSEGVFDRLKTALAAQPDNTRLRMQYARLLTRTDMPEARQQFQILLDKSPNDPDLLFSMALIQREMDDLEAARDKLEKLVGLKKRGDEANYYLGKIAEQQDRFDDALMHYMQVKPGRDFVNSTKRLAALLLTADRNGEHGEYFEQLRERYPQFRAELYVVEVDTLNDSHRYQQSLEVLNRALLQTPDSTNLQYMRSMVAEKLGDLEQMEADLRGILDREPNNATVLNALGYTLANRTTRYAEAQSLIERALDLSPGEPAILDSLGWVNYRLGDYQQALEHLRRAYKLFPDPEVAAHLGEVLWVVGEVDAARSIWNTALADSPKHEILRETMRRLDAELQQD